MKGFFCWAVVTLCCFIICCNKSINAGANKAYVSITNAVQKGQSVNIYYNGASIPLVPPLPLDSTTGANGIHYLPLVAGVHNFTVSPDGTIQYLNGNIAFQANQYYSVFLYDSVRSGKVRSLILTDYLTAPRDTMSYYRFLNLAPGTDTLTYLMTHKRDSIIDTILLFRVPYVGPEPNPANYSRFGPIRAGKWRFATVSDTGSVIFNVHPIDSLYFSGGKIYSLFTKGFLSGTGKDTLTAHLLQHN